jgi:CheY-like chemotaxis protein
MSYISENQNFSNNHILVVDDFLDNSLLLATLLELEGYEVDIADNGRTAISKIEANPPNLVLSDLMMPELDGIGLAYWIRQHQPSLPIVLITAYDQLPTVDDNQVSVDGFIRKPVNIDDLLMAVRGILHARKNCGEDVSGTIAN